jgi:IS1 family transposase
MWSFVGFKGKKQWIWLAIDVLTKEIVGVYIGKRDKTGARVLWDSIPAIYRQCAVSYTDFCPFLRNSFSKKKTQSGIQG